MKLNIDVNDLKVKAEKIGGIILKGVAAIGMISLLGKVNDELSKYGVHVGYSTDGGLDIKAGGKKQPQAEKKPPQHDNPKTIMFNSNSVQERSIIDLMYAAERTYSDSTKRSNAESIFNIAMAGDDDTKLVAIQALSRIARSTYSDGVKNYVSSAISDIGTSKQKPEEEKADEEVPNEE